ADEIARHRVLAVGTQDAAQTLAEQADGVLDKREPGTWEVLGPDIFAATARGLTPDGLDEVIPVLEGGDAPFLASPAARGIRHVTSNGASRAPATGIGALDGIDLGPLTDVLPPIVSCSDSVEGVWMSREHFPLYEDWYLFTLDIHRDPSDQNHLVGIIR